MTKFRWFWAWDDGKEELWLREMSQNGWHFETVIFPGNFTFKEGKPKDYVYRLDYNPDKDDVENYRQIFEDAGWDYMGEMNAWQYFRKEAVKGESMEIFTDGASKAKKYQRIMLFMTAMFPVIFISMMNISRADGTFYQVFSVILSVIMIVYVYAVARLLGRITQLLKK